MDSRGQSETKWDTIVLRGRVNWTAVWFFAVLGLLHLTNASISFLRGQWEAYLSVVIGTIFVTASILATRMRHEVVLLSDKRIIRVRYGAGKWSLGRSVPFERVRGVRVTLDQSPRTTESQIDILCDHEDIACPPTTIPRQEALLLAMALNVELIKVFDEESEKMLARLESHPEQSPM